MINFLNMWMPWVLELIYILMVPIYLVNGKQGPTIYWIGATILNAGVIVMTRTSK